MVAVNIVKPNRQELSQPKTPFQFLEKPVGNSSYPRLGSQAEQKARADHLRRQDRLSEIRAKRENFGRFVAQRHQHVDRTANMRLLLPSNFFRGSHQN
jgi:hypothetical protein